jgi:hypothetical protein
MTDHPSLLVSGLSLSLETRHPCRSQEQPSQPRRPHCSSVPSIDGPGDLPMSWPTGGTFPIWRARCLTVQAGRAMMIPAASRHYLCCRHLWAGAHLSQWSRVGGRVYRGR